MELTHRFTVPTSVDKTWEHFNDIAAVAQCFPGAVVTDATADSFAGSVKVKLGPIALQYNGSGTFLEKDELAKKFVVEAKGKDKRGNGTAGATVTVTMEADGSATVVEVETDLAVTGKPAQFGRGVMQDVSDKLLGKFVECLEKRLSTEASASAGAATFEKESGEAGAEVTGDPLGTGAVHPAPTDGAAGADSASGPPDSSGSAGAAGASTGAPRVAAAPAPEQEDSLDLGAAVLPVLLKTYAKPLAAVGLVGLVFALIRRWRH